MKRLLLLLAAPLLAETCQTIMLPESHNTGGVVNITGFKTNDPSSGWKVWTYTPPPNATRIGLEFWSHAFPPGAPQNTQYILVYLNRPDKWARRMFHQWNQGHAADGAVNFPLSTFLHTVRDGSPPEWLLVGYLNNWTEPVQAYLIVTIRECVQ